jgi:two-component system sensor histidine kinase DegS
MLWSRTLRELNRHTPEEIDNTFRVLSSTRADLAAVEERCSDLDDRMTDTRGEQEVLRSVFRGIEDMEASVTPTTNGASRLRNTSRQVFQIIEEERMRIARDMHDGPAQSMANLVLQAEILERLIARDPALVISELADFKDGVREVLDDTRRLIFDLRPMTLDDLGLVPTLRKFVKEFEDRFGIRTGLRVIGEEGRLPGNYEPTLFRIIQEALNNARKHAQAKNAEVVITFAKTSVSAAIRDDGVGFDLDAAEEPTDGDKHLGLTSMRERAELESGDLSIRTAPGKGTEVLATFSL